MLKLVAAPVLGLVVLLLTSSSALAQRHVPIPDGFSAADITPDGSLVVGTHDGGGAFIWDWRNDPSPTLLGGGGAVAVSDDGSVILGQMGDPLGSGLGVAALWTASGGWQSLGGFDDCSGSLSNAYALSGDGTVAVGLAWQGCNSYAFRWTADTGMVLMDNLANGLNRASAVNVDGSIIGGFAQGTFDRTPALWSADGTGTLYDINDQGEIYGFNNDGSTIVGEYNGLAFVDDGVSLDVLGNLNGGFWVGNATDISEDGQVVVGYDILGLSREAWVWTPSTGFLGLRDIMQAQGISGLPDLYTALAVSDDGNVIVGGQSAGGPFVSAYLIELETTDAWTDLGGGTSGIAGVPELTGNGTLAGGTTVFLSLENAPPSSLMLAWLSFNPTPFAALGGTVHAAPFSNQFMLSSSPTGTLNVNAAWPVGVPPGTEATFQFIVSDPSVIWDLTLSNGLRATTP